jgi:hypothetical protein
MLPLQTTVEAGVTTTEQRQMTAARGTPRPSPRYESLSTLWLDWVDHFDDLEGTGPGWRSCYSSSETKHFSRVKQVFTGMKEYINRHHHGEQNSSEQIIALLDAQFLHLKRSLTRTIAWMQQEGTKTKVGAVRKSTSALEYEVKVHDY